MITVATADSKRGKGKFQHIREKHFYYFAWEHLYKAEKIKARNFVKKQA